VRACEMLALYRAGRFSVRLRVAESGHFEAHSNARAEEAVTKNNQTSQEVCSLQKELLERFSERYIMYIYTLPPYKRLGIYCTVESMWRTTWYWNAPSNPTHPIAK